MADKKKKFVVGDEPKVEKKKADKAPKKDKAPKADKPKKADKPAKAKDENGAPRYDLAGDRTDKLPSLKDLNPKTIMKRVNVKDADAVKAEVQRLDEIAVAAAEQGADNIEEAALAASHALSEAAASGEADVLPLSPDQSAQVVKDREKASRLKKSEITPEQEMAQLESAKKKQAAKEAKDKERAEKKAQREAEKAAKAAEAETRKMQRRDPAFLLAERRRRAEERGKPYPVGCAHCGSPDLVSNRSAYNASIDGGEPVVVQDYICRVCNLYSKAVASTGELISKESTVKNLGYVQERENYHRAKGHLVEKAIELAGVDDSTPTTFGGEQDDEVTDLYFNARPEAADQIIGLNKLLAVALFGTDEATKAQARKVLSDGIVLTFDFNGLTVDSGSGTVKLESEKGEPVTEQAAV